MKVSNQSVHRFVMITRINEFARPTAARLHQSIFRADSFQRAGAGGAHAENPAAIGPIA